MKGKLCIFLGYAAGVGKTYAMLEAAHALQKEGVDVVAGYVEPHDRPKTKEKEEGLEKIPCEMVEYKGIALRELNLDAVLKRKPELALIDELAHTNAPGMRHRKRYEDIEEILEAGIDVYTTVNIQHLESLNDIVGSISGIRVKERIPDFVFDRADQVRVVDIDPDVLIERLKEGKIYKIQQAERALTNFFVREKLVALRELALRRTADKVNQAALEEKKLWQKGEGYAGEHVLVCVSPSPSSEKVIRSASRLAYAFHAKFTALYVETPYLQEAGEDERKRRDENLNLAEVLGANIVRVFGEDVAFQIGQYAEVSGVTKIVLGRTKRKGLSGFLLNQLATGGRGTLADQLTRFISDIDVYIIPDQKNPEGKWTMAEALKRRKRKAEGSPAKEMLYGAGILAAATAAGKAMEFTGLLNTNIILVYLLGILVLSMYSTRRWVPALASLTSVILFNYFFVPPLYSLNVSAAGYDITFIFMLVSALLVSGVIHKERRQAAESSKLIYRTGLLLENSRRLRRVSTIKELLIELSSRIVQLTNLSIVFYVCKDGKMTGPWLFPRKGMSREELKKRTGGQKERAVAEWVMVNRKRAGCCTHTLPMAEAMYLPVQAENETYAVMGILLEEKREISTFEYGVLTAMLNEAALVFARIYLVNRSL